MKYLVHSMGRSGTRCILRALEGAGYPVTYTHKLGKVDKSVRYVISPIREPVQRNISAYFRNCCKDKTPAVDAFLSDYPHDVPLTFFDREIEPHWGIDVYSKPFYTSQGWQLYQGEQVKLLVIRLEDFDKWGVAFKALTGKEAPKLKRNNDTQHASYKSFSVPDDYEIAMRNTKYYRHFYGSSQ